MRFIFLCSLLSARGMAMPGHNLPRSEIASVLPSTTATAGATLATPASIASAEAINGTSADLYKWTTLFVNMYSSTAVNESNATATFLKYLPLAAGVGDCVLDESDAASCDAHVVTPLVKLVRSGISKLYTQQKKAHAKFYARLAQWQSEAVTFVSDFTHYDISNISVSAYFSIPRIATTLMNPTGLRSSLSSAWARIKSVGLSFSSGIFSATQSDVTEMFKNADSIKQAFAESGALLKKVTLSGLATAAINLAWVSDDVYIAKASSDVNKQKPADMALSILGDNARTCDGNGTCYFFIVSQKASNLNTNKWEGAKGLDKITNYNITLLELAKSAEWYQNHFGGYLPKPNASEIFKSLQKNDTRPALSYFANIPLVNYDNLSSLSSNETSTSANSTEQTFLNVLSQEVSKLKGWPY